MIAKATDSVGNVGTSSTTTFTYNTSAPTVAVTYPVSGTTHGANWNGVDHGHRHRHRHRCHDHERRPGRRQEHHHRPVVGRLLVQPVQPDLCGGHLGHDQLVAHLRLRATWSPATPTASWSQATDSYGNVGTSSTTTFTYNTTAPSVAITYPVNNTTYGANWTGADHRHFDSQCLRFDHLNGEGLHPARQRLVLDGLGQHLHGDVPELRGGHKRDHQLVAHDPDL